MRERQHRAPRLNAKGKPWNNRCPITTADKFVRRWALSFINGFTDQAPKRGWQRFLRDGWSIGHHEWRARYRLYLKSRSWTQRKAGALNRAEHRCTLCSATRRLDVHHTHYRNVGNERIEDLRVLCRSCHETVHAAPQLATVPMDANTAAILRQRRIEREQLAEAAPYLEERQRRGLDKARRHAIMDAIAHPTTPEPRRIKRRPKAEPQP